MAQSLPRVAALMCHAPIVIPPIGGARGQQCASTTKAMEAAAQVMVDSGAESVLLISPHTPRHRQAYGYVSGKILSGHFGAFGEPRIRCAFDADEAAQEAVIRICTANDIAISAVYAPNLDHGALVPLWFLHQAGYQGKLSVFGFPWEASGDSNRRFGSTLAQAMDSLKRPWAFLASGDMSHALKPGAPAEFHPRAHEFDESVTTYVESNRIGGVTLIDPSLRVLAAEDVVDSLEVAAGLLGENPDGNRVLSYEGPFGVGYLVAVLQETPAPC